MEANQIAAIDLGKIAAEMYAGLEGAPEGVLVAPADAPAPEGVLVLRGGHPLPDHRSLQAGAKGYLLKDVFFEELETAIRTVHAGARRIPPAIAERLAERMAGSDLTSREMEVLELIVRGQSNKEIGSSLTISEATVKSHINNILSKLGVTDRTQAATTALQRGLVHLR